MTDLRLPAEQTLITKEPESGGPAAAPVGGRFAHGGESYRVLVWRRFRRNVSGMMGLVLVAALLIMAVFADFFAPMDPKDGWLPKVLSALAEESALLADGGAKADERYMSRVAHLAPPPKPPAEESKA